MIEQLRLEIDDLIHKAEDADSTPLDDGLSIPEEISRREERRKRLEKARAAIEQRYEAERQEKRRLSMNVSSLNVRNAVPRANGQAANPSRPPLLPPAKKQHNFTEC